MRLWIVCYDITDDRRRRRVASLLGRCMERVQYSVFEAWLPQAELRAIIEEVTAELDLDEDRLRAYPLAVRTPERYQVRGTQQPSQPIPDYWIA